MNPGSCQLRYYGEQHLQWLLRRTPNGTAVPRLPLRINLWGRYPIATRSPGLKSLSAEA